MVMRLAVVLHSLRGHWSSHGASRWAAGGPRWHWWPPLEAKRRRTRGTPTVAWWGHGGRGSSHAWMHGVTHGMPIGPSRWHAHVWMRGHAGGWRRPVLVGSWGARWRHHTWGMAMRVHRHLGHSRVHALVEGWRARWGA